MSKIFISTFVSGGPSGPLGDWEQFTRGMGSKLMASMGYVMGAGLGKRSEGRIEPVPAMLYPVGRSLDWCMNLREKAGEKHVSKYSIIFILIQTHYDSYRVIRD